MVRSSIDANEFPWPRMVMHQPHYLMSVKYVARVAAADIFVVLAERHT